MGALGKKAEVCNLAAVVPFSDAGTEIVVGHAPTDAREVASALAGTSKIDPIERVGLKLEPVELAEVLDRQIRRGVRHRERDRSERRPSRPNSRPDVQPKGRDEFDIGERDATENRYSERIARNGKY